MQLAFWKTTSEANQASQINHHAFFLLLLIYQQRKALIIFQVLFFWKFPRAQVRVFYTVYMVLFGNSLRSSLSRLICLWSTSEVSHMVLWIFCLCSSQLLKTFLSAAWRRKQATGNPQDMMVQRKRVPCCLPPASWVSGVPACTSCLAHPLCPWPSTPTYLLAAILLPTSQSSHSLLLHQLLIACWRDWGFLQHHYAFSDSSFLIYAMSFWWKSLHICGKDVFSPT